MDEMKLRGAAATAHNKRRYAEEIAKMEAAGEKFKANQFMDASVEWFAERCGFSRFVLEKGALKEQFAKDVARIGVAVKIDTDDADRLRKKAEDTQKLASDFQRQLNLKDAENQKLRDQVESLTKQVRELQLRGKEKDRSLEHMLATGERFFL